MTYSFEQIEYKAEDGTILWLDGCAECEVYYQKAEPQTWEDPGCPAEVLVESIESVSIGCSYGERGVCWTVKRGRN